MAVLGADVVLFTGGAPDRLTGGNLYNRHLCACLQEAGWGVAAVTEPPGAHSRLTIVDSIAIAPAFPWIAGRPPGARAVALMHMLPSLHARSSRERLDLRRLETAFLRRVDLVVAASEDLARWLLRLDVPPGRLRVIPPGKDGPQPPPEPRRRTGSGGNGLRLLCVANWFPVKNLHVLVHALSLLPEDVRLDLVGHPGADPAYAERVRSAIERHHAGARLREHGPVPPERLGERYAAADIFVLPSAHEGYATAVAEALWFGLPVVATAVGGIPHLVRPGVEGLLVPAGHPAALAQAVRRLRDNVALRGHMAVAALARGARLPGWADARAALRDALLPFLA